MLELPGRLPFVPACDIPNPIEVTWAPNASSVVWNIRMTRIVGVAFIGGGLSVAGASYQCLFRNPLVSESILGVSNGACFGAVLAILLALSTTLVNVFAFVGGALAVFLTYSFSRMLRGNQTLLLVLTGMVVSSIFSAGISIVKYVAPTETALPEITFWLMGSFAKIQTDDLVYLVPSIAACVLVLMQVRWKMNVLSLGDNEARTLGGSVWFKAHFEAPLELAWAPTVISPDYCSELDMRSYVEEFYETFYGSGITDEDYELIMNPTVGSR